MVFAVFVVGRAELGVGEDLVGFADGLEFGVGFGVVGVFVWVGLEGGCYFGGGLVGKGRGLPGCSWMASLR